MRLADCLAMVAPLRHEIGLPREVSGVYGRDGYARVSKADGTQLLDLQRDALSDAGVGLAAARARGRLGGRPRKMDVAMPRLAIHAMADRDTTVQDLVKGNAKNSGAIRRRVAQLFPLRRRSSVPDTTARTSP